MDFDVDYLVPFDLIHLWNLVKHAIVVVAQGLIQPLNIQPKVAIRQSRRNLFLAVAVMKKNSFRPKL